MGPIFFQIGKKMLKLDRNYAKFPFLSESVSFYKKTGLIKIF